jgi:HD-like signal output (HDOD) protein
MSALPLVNLDQVNMLGARREVASAILQMLNDADAGARDVANVAAADPLLTARIMRMANSAYYGLSGKVNELHFAVSVLGFLTIRSLATASLLDKLTPISRDAWRRYATMAAVASHLAPFFNADPAEAFCAGMMQDLGELVLAKHDPRGYPMLHRELAPLPLFLRDNLAREREHDIYGMDHTEISAQLLRTWSFPEQIVDAVLRHHDPDRDLSELSRTLHSAALIAPYLPRGVDAWDTTIPLPDELLHLDMAELFGAAGQFVEEFLGI